MNYCRLDEICNLNMGQSPNSNSYNTEKKGLPFFQGNADFGKIYPIAKTWCNSPTKIVMPGDLLISVRAPIGALNFANEKSCIGRGLAGITVKKNINLKYVYYFLKSKRDELNNKGTGSTFKAISKNGLGEFPIKYIDVEKQEIIVKKLDSISKIIDNKNELLDLFNNLIKSRFVEMFGDPIINELKWKKEKLFEVAPIKQYKEPIPEPFWLLNLDMIEPNTGKIVKYIYSTFQEAGNSTYVFNEKNILYSKLRPYLNKVVIPDQAGMCTSELLPLYPSKCLERVFLAYLLRNDSFVKFIQEKVAGAKMPRVSMDSLKRFECIIPPLEIQYEFVAFVNQTDKLKFMKLKGVCS